MRKILLGHRLISMLGLACVASSTHCGGPRIQSDPKFSGGALRSRAVLVLPIAVTDDYGDERTGIVLDRESRERATKLVCDSAVDVRDDVRVVCFDGPELANSAEFLKQLLLDYARDRAIPPSRWHELEQRTGASFVLLFRPEAVSASQRASKPSHGPSVYVVPTSLISAVPAIPIVAEGAGPHVGSVTTSRTYTLSSCLVDLREAAIVRVGTHSAKDSTSTTEPPEASQHLHGIMRDLVKGLLER